MHYTEMELPFPKLYETPNLVHLKAETIPQSRAFDDIRFKTNQFFSLITMSDDICTGGADLYYKNGNHLFKPAGKVSGHVHFNQSTQGNVFFELCRFADRVNPSLKAENEKMRKACYAFWDMHETCGRDAFETTFADVRDYFFQVCEQYAMYINVNLDIVKDAVEKGQHKQEHPPLSQRIRNAEAKDTKAVSSEKEQDRSEPACR